MTTNPPIGDGGSFEELLQKWQSEAGPFYSPSSLAAVMAAALAATAEADKEQAKVRSGPDDAPISFRDAFHLNLSGEQLGLRRSVSGLSSPEKESLEKLQVSVAPSIYALLKAWSVSEGRDITSVLLQAVEVGLRRLKADGAIPKAAIDYYERHCSNRLALGEAEALSHTALILDCDF